MERANIKPALLTAGAGVAASDITTAIINITDACVVLQIPAVNKTYIFIASEKDNDTLNKTKDKGDSSGFLVCVLICVVLKPATNVDGVHTDQTLINPEMMDMTPIRTAFSTCVIAAVVLFVISWSLKV